MRRRTQRWPAGSPGPGCPGPTGRSDRARGLTAHEHSAFRGPAVGNVRVSQKSTRKINFVSGSEGEPMATGPEQALEQMRAATGRLRDQAWMVAPMTASLVLPEQQDAFDVDH